MYHYSLSSSPSSWHIIITNHYESSSSSSSSSSETSSSSSTSLSSSINIIIIIFFSSSSSLSSLHLSTFSSSRHHRRRRRDRVDVGLPFRVVSAASSGTARKRLRSAPGFPETETAPNGPLFNCKSLRIWSQPGTQNFGPSDSSHLGLPDWSLHYKQTIEKNNVFFTFLPKHIEFPRLYSFSLFDCFWFFQNIACSPCAVKNSRLSKNDENCECA